MTESDLTEKEMNNNYHLSGTFYLNEDGRNHPIREGYRPAYKVGGEGGSTEIVWLESETVYPGGSANAKLKVLTPEHLREKVEEGDIIDMYEGPHKVGEFEIYELNF